MVSCLSTTHGSCSDGAQFSSLQDGKSSDSQHASGFNDTPPMSVIRLCLATQGLWEAADSSADEDDWVTPSPCTAGLTLTVPRTRRVRCSQVTTATRSNPTISGTTTTRPGVDGCGTSNGEGHRTISRTLLLRLRHLDCVDSNSAEQSGLPRDADAAEIKLADNPQSCFKGWRAAKRSQPPPVQARARQAAAPPPADEAEEASHPVLQPRLRQGLSADGQEPRQRGAQAGGALRAPGQQPRLGAEVLPLSQSAGCCEAGPGAQRPATSSRAATTDSSDSEAETASSGPELPVQVLVGPTDLAFAPLKLKDVWLPGEGPGGLCVPVPLRSGPSCLSLADAMRLSKARPGQAPLSFGSSVHLISRGSQPCRPCMFERWTGRCSKSWLCDFCHLHVGRKRRRNKAVQQRWEI